jgi:glycosyltransferase involved in cell wall biosynthesis
LKGTDVLLPAFRRFHESFSGWQLLLVGEAGSQLSNLLAPYQDLVDSGHIHYEGFVSDSERLRELYQSAAIFAQPSRRETSSVALAEAIREGCLPICTEVFPVAELLGEWANELAVPVDDVAALTRCMSNLAAAGPATWDRMRESLMARTADWEWDRQLSPVIEAYLEQTQGTKVLQASR